MWDEKRDGLIVVPSTQQLVKADARPNPALVYLAALGSPASRVTMARSLEVAATFFRAEENEVAIFPWHQLRYEHTQAYRAYLLQHYAFTTANKHLAALKGVLKECWRLGLLDVESYHKAIDLAPVKGTRIQAGRVLSSEEQIKLLEACKNKLPVKTMRNQVVCCLGLYCGLRREEIALLDLNNYKTNKIVVMGKGNKERSIPLSKITKFLLDGWLAARGSWAGPLLTRVSKLGKIDPRPLTDDGIYYILQQLGEKAGLVHFSPHDLRRTFITTLLSKGVDAFVTQSLAGHAKPETTKKYDRRPETAKEDAIKAVFDSEEIT